MEVSKKSQADPVILSNYEVLKLLNELKGQNTQSQANSHLATILYEATHYLQDAHCGKQTEAEIEGLLQDLSSFPVKLTKTEKLMIVNDPPKSALQLSLLIKDLEDRMTEEQTEALLKLVLKHVESTT